MLSLPNEYLVLDIETSGFRPADDYILQVGYALVFGGQVVHNGVLFVSTPDDVLEAYDVGDYVSKMLAEGNDGYVKSADVRARGVPRVQAFTLLREFVKVTMALPGAAVIGHNFARFDLPFIEHQSLRAGIALEFDRSRVVDTGALFKAGAIGAVPDDTISSWEWFCQIRDKRCKGVLWNLAFATKKYGIAEKHGIDLAGAHDAGFDCLMTHHLYQAMREELLVTT